MNEELAGLLRDHRMFHTEFQMDYFITGRSGETDWGKYRQALRELEKRHRALEDLYHELAQKERELRRHKALIADTEREFARFYEQASILKDLLGELDDEMKARLDAQEWEAQARAKMAKELMAHGRLSDRTLDLLVSLPREMKTRLVDEMNRDQKRLISSVLAKDSGIIQSAPDPVEGPKVRALIEG